MSNRFCYKNLIHISIYSTTLNRIHLILGSTLYPAYVQKKFTFYASWVNTGSFFDLTTRVTRVAADVNQTTRSRLLYMHDYKFNSTLWTPLLGRLNTIQYSREQALTLFKEILNYKTSKTKRDETQIIDQPAFTGSFCNLQPKYSTDGLFRAKTCDWAKNCFCFWFWKWKYYICDKHFWNCFMILQAY